MQARRDYPTRLFALGSLLLAFFFLLPGSQAGLGARLDDFNFRLWSNFFPPENLQVADNIALLELPPAIGEARQPSFASAAELEQILAQLAEYKAAAVGISTDLDASIWRQQDILSLLPPASAKAEPLAIYEALEQRAENSPVVWRVTPSRLDPGAPLIDREFRWPLLFNLHDRLLQYRLVKQASSHHQARLIDYRDGQILAGFELSLLAMAQQSNSLRWQIPDTLRVGATTKSVSMYGSVRPSPQEQAATAIQAMALKPGDLTQDNTEGKLVILASLADPQLPEQLALLNAVLTDQYSRAPWWQFLALLPLTLLLWIYSLFAFRRFTSGALCVSATAIIASIASLSIVLQVKFGVWLETGDAILYCLCVSATLLAHSIFRNWHIRSRMEADDARLELAQLYLEHENPKSATEQLLQTAMSDDTADLLMETGKVYERKRDYRAARDVYSTVHNYFPSHRQAEDALDDISSITGQHPSLNSTLILPDMPVEMPQLGRYELIRLLGKGAMGAVYLANDPTIRRQVAIKTLMLEELGEDREEMRDRFLREAETAGRLQHPNIATVYDVGEQGELAYITMDYVAGGTLADWVNEDQLLELPQLYELMERVCDALAYAHQQGVIHRDIKPGNILFNPEDMTVKVTDFGIARLADYSRTKTGAILGSPYYMSPEQVSGKKVGAASDIYSLGVSFYQLLCGGLPFEADSLAQLAWQITNKPHRNIGRVRKGLPRSATRIVNTALKKDPGERFASATEMGLAFDKGGKSIASSKRHSA